MNRFKFVLDHVNAPQEVPIDVMADEFKRAVDMAKLEGPGPEDDAAVIIIGAWIAFKLNADIATLSGYRRLLDICEARFQTCPTLQ